MVSKVLTFLVVFILASCGAKDSTTPVKINLFKGNIATASSTATAGGVLIFGRSEDGKHAFRVGAPNANQPLELNLAKGKWEFGAITWEGGVRGAMMGVNRCAHTGFQELRDNEMSVNLNLSQANCDLSFNGRRFSEPEYLSVATPGEFLPFKAYPCFKNNLSDFTVTNCSGNSSNLSSYKIVFLSHLKGDVSGLATPLISGCYMVGQTDVPRLPLTNAGEENPLGFNILFYTNGICGGDPKLFSYKDGPINNQSPDIHKFEGASNTYNFYFINPGIAHDTRTPSVAGKSLAILGGAVGYNGTVYVNSRTVNYYISGVIPESAYEMCVTENISCSPDGWVKAANTGVLEISNIDNLHSLSLFYRNYHNNESVGTEPNYVYLTTSLKNLQPEAPTFTPGTNAFKFNWNSSLEINTIVEIKAYVCANASSCFSPLYYHTSDRSALGTTYYQSLSSENATAMTSGSIYYGKLVITDIFGYEKTLIYDPFIPAYDLNVP